MDLASYILKPVQRMGKYALLLQQLMKICPSPNQEQECPDFDDLRAAEQMVRFQLRHGNDLLAMDSLRDCDVNLKEQGRLLRQNEFLVGEGRNGKKHIRQVFLFEELILFSKANRFPDRKVKHYSPCYVTLKNNSRHPLAFVGTIAAAYFRSFFPFYPVVKSVQKIPRGSYYLEHTSAFFPATSSCHANPRECIH